MAEGRKSTLVLVAEHAGVSIATVSRVLNGLPASQKTADAVRAAASELGYVPDATARSLKAGKTEQIALAVADVGNPVYVAMMNQISRAVTDAGYRLVTSSTGNDPDDQIALLDSLNRGYADGVILSPLRVTESLINALQASRLPIVVIGSLPDNVEIDSVRADSVAGMALAVQHLADQGAKRVAFVNGPIDTVPGAARLRGYLAALEEQGMSMNADVQVNADDFTFEAGLVAAQALLDQSTPDAIVCANDLLAIATMKTLAKRGIRVPQDVLLIGMDDTELAELSTPSITSVNLGSVRRAKEAASLLIGRLKDPDAQVARVTIDPTLTIRESSVAPA
ncbi:LacI family DNA-binding transcriptional regulator [Rhodoglobus sp. NPDC076762]